MTPEPTPHPQQPDHPEHRVPGRPDRLDLRAVALGGGHGLAASLSALRHVVSDLTAVVTVADNGGSSGRLRHEFGALPPGDLRMALAALCGDDECGRRYVVKGGRSGARAGAWQVTVTASDGLDSGEGRVAVEVQQGRARGDYTPGPSLALVVLGALGALALRRR